MEKTDARNKFRGNSRTCKAVNFQLDIAALYYTISPSDMAGVAATTVLQTVQLTCAMTLEYTTQYTNNCPAYTKIRAGTPDWHGYLT